MFATWPPMSFSFTLDESKVIDVGALLLSEVFICWYKSDKLTIELIGSLSWIYSTELSVKVLFKICKT